MADAAGAACCRYLLPQMLFLFFRWLCPEMVYMKKGGLFAPLSLPVCRYQVIDVTAFVGLMVKPFDVFDVNSQADHLLPSLAFLGIAFPFLTGCLFCLFHISVI